MSNGLIGSLINPSMLARGDVTQRGDTAVVSPVEPVTERMNAMDRAVELPREVNRAGPKDQQALSQYEAFSGQSLVGAGVGFSAVV